MEKVQILTVKYFWPVFIVSILSTSCSNKKMIEDDDPRFKDINEEFRKVVKVDSIPAPTVTVERRPVVMVETKKSTFKNFKKRGAVSQVPILSTEGIEGFKARRPIVDPFYQNEKVVLAVSYFNVEAGELIMDVGPYKMVNGRKAYAFSMEVKTNKVFSLMYRVKNTAETLVDFEDLVPLTYSSVTNESNKHKEVRVFFEWQKNEVTHWEKSIKGSEAEKKKKIVWSVEPFSQNFISALFYLRAYKLDPGKRYAFRVVDSGKNYVFHAEVLRREKISTVVGDLNTVVIKPTFELGEEFKPTGDNLIWLTDDERKFIVRVESKIKIGTLVGKLKRIERGTPN